MTKRDDELAARIEELEKHRREGRFTILSTPRAAGKSWAADLLREALEEKARKVETDWIIFDEVTDVGVKTQPVDQTVMIKQEPDEVIAGRNPGWGEW